MLWVPPSTKGILVPTNCCLPTTDFALSLISDVGWCKPECNHNRVLAFSEGCLFARIVWVIYLNTREEVNIDPLHLINMPKYLSSVHYLFLDKVKSLNFEIYFDNIHLYIIQNIFLITFFSVILFCIYLFGICILIFRVPFSRLTFNIRNYFRRNKRKVKTTSLSNCILRQASLMRYFNYRLKNFVI